MTEFNSELARQALDLVRLNPDAHIQATWRCSTGQCFAGWTAVAADMAWVGKNADDLYGMWVYLPENFEVPEDYDPWNAYNGGAVTERNGRMIAHVADAAAIALGLSGIERDYLFSASNTREDIEAFIKAIENTEPGTEERETALDQAVDEKRKRVHAQLRLLEEGGD